MKSVASVVLSYLLVLSLSPSFLAPKAAAEAAGGAAKAPVRQTNQNAARREGELLIRFQEGISEDEKERLVNGRGSRRAKKLRGNSRVEQLSVEPGQNPDDVAAALRQSPGVEFVEPNFLIGRAQVMPDDARFGEQWALKNNGQTGGQTGADIGVAGAWQTATGTTSITIAVIDSGVDFSHPDLQNNQWTNSSEKENRKDDDRNGFVNDLHGWDWISDSGVIRDEQGHGTAVAGIIAAQGNNGLGTAGVMWRASLMSLRVLDKTGTGTVADAVEAIDYAASQGAQVINLSWGTEGESLALRDAIARAGQGGALVVASAGNGGRDIEAAPYYPASFDLPNVLAVASTDQFDNLATWSNWGASRVGVAVPGTDILTTRMGGDYWLVSGTSASAPLVSGISGLVKSARPWLTAESVRQAIVEGARRADALAGRVASGGVASAVGALMAGPGGAYEGPSGAGGKDKDGKGDESGKDRVTPRPEAPKHGGGKADEFKKEPPRPSTDAAANLPNLDEIRGQASHEPEAPEPSIRANLAPICDTCFEDPGGGGGGFAGDSEYSNTRDEPQNDTGDSGVDLGSRNFNWSTPLVHLPGRAGLDVDLTLYYNSLVWTKQGNGIQFNPDNGYPGPGFQLGFPLVQERYYDSDSGTYAYMLVTPTGSRVKLVYVGNNAQGQAVYEAIDSTYTQLIDYGTGGALVRTSDGTSYTFVNIASGEKRCTQIKDRNGNYISIAYNGANRVSQVTDTLARVIYFNYDADGNLASLTQARSAHGLTDTLVTFSYGSLYMQPSFPGLSVFGPNNTHISVLTRVTFPNGSRYDFEYNPFGQIHTIRNYAPDGHQLSYIGYNLPGSYWAGMSGQSDCPRFTERRDWVEYGVMNQSQEVVTSYATAADSSWSQMTLPDGTVHKEFYATSGWQKGLTTQTETWSGGVRRKWTTLAWTQDNTGLSYQKNPRISEVNLYDAAGNRRKTTFSYHSSFGLVHTIEEYAADAVTVLRRTHHDYKMDAAYIDRRIIGLPFQRQVFDTNWNLVSKVQYSYDWASWGGDMFQDTPAAATQHDRTNYGPSFIFGRGNLGCIHTFDVTDPNNANNTVQETKFRYNSTGLVLMERDHNWHSTTFDYADSYSDGVNRNTFAFPTRITDGDGNQSTTQYNYATGMVTRTSTPSSGTGAGTTYLTQTRTYDSVGRLERITTQNNGAYTRFSYPASMGYVQQYTTVVSGAGEAYSAAHFDGVGRVRATAESFPGSAGGYRATHHMYDSMGRRAQTSNPTEINGSWVPTGDDSAWVWTTQAYDWQGRPTLTTRPDGYTSESIYGGCGCAGGEVITVRDERGRRRKLYKDVFERLSKVEELNWDQTVYSTTTYTYNTRDQITQINHAGQLRTYEYDGRGRVTARTTPEQGRLTYAYNMDDTVSVITDARGATSSFTYNGRHLPNSITYGVPGGVAATPNVSFAYDAAGNRTQMSDGLGTMTYSYDSLSRLQWEERAFSGLGTFRLTYAYNLAGQLTSVTNPWGSQVGYTRDSAGQVTAVTGAGPNSFNLYAYNIAYRAAGVLKSQTYNNSRTLNITYDNRLRMKTWNVPGTLGWEYSYDHFNEHTGRVTYARNLYDSTLDRSYDYDHVGRLTIAYSGMDARAHVGVPGSSWGVQDGPYASPNFYDVHGNLTGRQGWGGANPWFSATYTNNKRNGFTYDAAGNLLNDLGQNFTYDATGQQATASYSGYSLTNSYDGDRLRGKKTENGAVTYYLRSTALGGQVAAEINSAGGWSRGYVYDGGGQLLVLQQGGSVRYVHQDPITKSQRITDTIGTLTAAIDLDPWGGETNRSQNSGVQPRKFTTYERDGNGSDDAMMRRYNRWHARFDQPDPFDGSLDITDPQTFNRYAYSRNDPVNLIDPTGLCTFNIRVIGGNNINADTRRAMEREITRIFNQAGHQVQFDNPANADRTYNLNLTNFEPSHLPTALGATSPDGSGGISNRGAAYLTRIRGSLEDDPNPGMRALGRHNENFGTALGRVAAHEAGHYLLQFRHSDNPRMEGLMRDQFRGDSTLFLRNGDNNRRFEFTAQQAQQLAQLCQPPAAPANPATTPSPGVGGGGGGIDRTFYGYGYGGYPSWWYHMWAFVAWVNSIRVEVVTVRVLDE
jgi:RHS repeat-associated protein